MYCTFTFSCKNNNQSDKTTHNSSLIDSITQTRIDSSKWLKPTRGIRNILEDNKGNLWFTSPDYVCMYNGEIIKYFTNENGLNIVGTVHQDQNETIWVEDGFNIYRYNSNKFTPYKLSDESSSIEKQKEGNNIWFQKGVNTSDTIDIELGIFRFNQGNSNFFPLPVNKTLDNKFRYYPTTKALSGKDSTIWFGTMEKVFGFKNGSFITLGRKEMGREKDTRQMGIRGLFIDSKENLWIADNGAGIFVYDGKKTINFTKQHHLDEGDSKEKTLHRAFSIAEDTLGNMWFGTVYSGVWKFNPITKEFTNYSKEFGILSDNIWTIYKTKNGELLFAGETPGAVYKFNGESFDRIY
ncbi:MAG: hypothetical protein JKY48_15750 [Flavobacteriales bacterium]|nr:hypothetical protein [Flavobacteriales bacterium]